MLCLRVCAFLLCISLSLAWLMMLLKFSHLFTILLYVGIHFIVALFRSFLFVSTFIISLSSYFQVITQRKFSTLNAIYSSLFFIFLFLFLPLFFVSRNWIPSMRMLQLPKTMTVINEVNIINQLSSLMM